MLSLPFVLSSCLIEADSSDTSTIDDDDDTTDDDTGDDDTGDDPPPDPNPNAKADAFRLFYKERSLRTNLSYNRFGLAADAVAATMIEYSRAPRSSSSLTNCATLERFWPTAT